VNRLATLALAATVWTACNNPVEDPTPPTPQGPTVTVGADTPRYVIVDIGTLNQRPFVEGAIAYAINNSGQVVGSSWAALEPHCADGGIPTHGFLWRDSTITDLGTLGGCISIAAAINERGQIVGRSRTAAGDWHGFLWEAGAMRDLGTLGGTTSNVVGINNLGQVAGTASTTDGVDHAFVWRDGVMQDLGTLGGPTSSAADISATGGVVGASATASGETHAILWQDGAMRDLGTLGGTYSAARAINQSGAVVGESTDSTGERHAFSWSDGVMQDLGVLPGSNANASRALAVNALGHVAGTSGHGGGDDVDGVAGFLWSGGGLQDIGKLEGSIAVHVTGLNARDHVIGFSLVRPPGESLYDHAFVSEDGVIYDLGGLHRPGVQQPDKWREAHAINARGDIVGLSCIYSFDTCRAVLWRRMPSATITVVP
jgi:probable HAF family extracellular repeat protein